MMDEIIPWEEWVSVINPCYPEGKSGRSPRGIKKCYGCKGAPFSENVADRQGNNGYFH